MATAPTWFFFARKEGTSLGLVTLTPFFVATPIGFLAGRGPVLAALALYGVVMLAVLPKAVRRGALGLPLDEALSLPGARWAARLAPPVISAELTVQRDVLVLALLGCVAFAGLFFNGAAQAAPMALFLLCALAASLSPALAFSESARLGTLEPLLVVLPRGAVFRLKALTSLGVTLLGCGVVPLALMGASELEGASVIAAFSWLVAMAFFWAVGLATSVHGAGVAFAMVSAWAAAFLGAFVQVLVFALVSLAVGSALGSGHSRDGAMAVVFFVSIDLAVLVAWRRFVHQPAAPARLAVLAAGLSVVVAAAVGALSALTSPAS